MTAKRDCRCPRARHEHGTLAAYQNDHCRCFPCCLNRSRIRARHEIVGHYREYDWRPAIGVARRLQALTAIGHSDQVFATRLDMDRSYVIRLRRGTTITGNVTRPVWEAVAALYDELWDKPYDGPYSVRTKRLAKRKGWLPPLCWDDASIDDPDATPEGIFTTGNIDHTGYDEIAVERIMAGTLQIRGSIQSPDLVEAVRRLTKYKLSDAQIGARVGRSKQAVMKLRERYGIPSSIPSGRNDEAA